MAIRLFLDLSTAHVTHEEMQMIDNDHDAKLPVSASNEYGAWLYTLPNDMLNTYEDLGACPNLRAILDFARDNDCGYVHLDRDADEHPGLPTFDW
jgi:hypothetical protein